MSGKFYNSTNCYLLEFTKISTIGGRDINKLGGFGGEN
jgi:hypothetical protein